MYTGELDTKLRRNGRGTYNYNNTSFKYTGEWNRGVKSGNGMFSICGGYYEGTFENGEITGQGKRVWDAGRTYEGDFLQGEMHGHGTMIMVTGEQYVGEFHQNQRHGDGELTSPDGTVYQGTFESHKKNGEGTEYMRGGAIFVGIFANGKRHGAGTLTFPSGECLKGTWHQGDVNPEAEGGATFQDVNANGFKYVGGWSNGKATESGSGVIMPMGDGIAATESTDDSPAEDGEESAATLPDGKRWIAELAPGNRLSGWTFSVSTTKQMDKKTRIIPETGRRFQIEAWLVAPALSEEEEEEAAAAAAAAAEAVATDESGDVAAPEKEPFTPIQTNLLVLVPTAVEGEESIGDGESTLVEPLLDASLTPIFMDVDESGVAHLPDVDVDPDAVPGKYTLNIFDTTTFGKGSTSLGFVQCTSTSILVELSVGGGGSKDKGKKGKKGKKK